jgi:hypothetical protein
MAARGRMGVLRLKMILVCLLFLASPVLHGANATGFSRREGCSFLDGEALHLQTFKGEKLHAPIILRIPQPGGWASLPDLGWFEAEAMDCARQDQCESIRHSKIRILHVSSTWFIPFRGRIVNGVSGEFIVEFPDGTNMEGTFKAKIRESHSEGTCE